MKKITSLVIILALMLIPSYAIDLTEQEYGQLSGDYGVLALSNKPIMISPIEYEEFPYDESVKLDWVAPLGIAVSYYRVRVRRFNYDDSSKSFIQEDVLRVDTIVNAQTTEFDVSKVYLGAKCKFRYAIAAVTVDGTEYWTEGYFYTGNHNGILSPPISFHVGNYFSDLTKNQIYNACQTWNEELFLGYEVVNTYPFTQGTDLTEHNSGDGLNCITGVYNGNDGVLMMEYECYYATDCKPFEIDIEVNRSQPWANSAQEGKYDVQSSITHELGHAIGLTDKYDSPMSEWTMYCEGRMNSTHRRTPEADEIVAALNFY